MRTRVLIAVTMLVMAVGLVSSQPPAGKQKAKERPASLTVDLKEPPVGLVKNPRFMTKSADETIPAHYTLAGDAAWAWCTTTGEYTDAGIALHSGIDKNKDGKREGNVTQRVTGFPGGVGQWFRFSFRGLAEKEFAVGNEGLFMKVNYFAKGGTNPLDGVTQYLDLLIERDRKLLDVNGKYLKNGGAVWKTYVFDFRLPFAEIDTLDLAVGFRNGSAKVEKDAEFYITDFSLAPIPAPVEAAKAKSSPKEPTPALKSLMPLGGRWYYQAEATFKERPATLVVNATNAHRLFYYDGRLSNPFAENMTAWLRPGNLDLKGNTVEEDRFVPDNVVLEFKDGKEMIVHARNLPNHPTAKFPDREGNRNPNSIQEKDQTYYLPLEPVRNPNAVAMDKTNSNRGLPMGAIGFAINGVAFFNPFDIGMEEAVNLMDRCCGHPAPNNLYHYHKYPVCVKSPFVDDGEGHSPLIGFALDGFPLYGPYVAKGLMAKDDKEKPLDAFNMRFDDERGWHYHVTPGQYPYLIGGFAGTQDARNGRRGPPR
ncbi:hypothetical protein BH11PLA2_BH11PLA2_42290 [soil metagenome]